MRCPFCQNPDTQVIDSRAPEEGYAIRRRRKCPACGKRFTTFERAHLPIPAVVKRNGQRTDYNRAKLQASMTLALRKRPVTPEQLEEAVDSVEQAMIMLGDREIESSDVGELVLGALQKLDTRPRSPPARRRKRPPPSVAPAGMRRGRQRRRRRPNDGMRCG